MIEWIKKMLCRHDYKRPYKAKRVYMCKKCGKVIKIKI